MRTKIRTRKATSLWPRKSFQGCCLLPVTFDMTEDQLDTRDKIGGGPIIRDQKDVFDIQ